MNNFWLDTVNLVCTSILGLLSFIDNISKRQFARKTKIIRDALDWIKKVRVKLSIVLIIGVIAFWTNKEKYKNIDNEKIAADKAFQKELDRRDSINQKRFNESLSKASSSSSASIAETMIKYYLKYDSTQHKIESVIKDTANRVNKITEKIVNNTTDAEPELDIPVLRFNKLRNDSLEFMFTLACKKTAIHHLNLKLQVYLEKGGDFTYCPQFMGFTPKDAYISSNTSNEVNNVTITTLKNIYQAYFYITGFYIYKEKNIPVEFLLFYNFRDHTFGTPGNKEVMLNLFKQKVS